MRYVQYFFLNFLSSLQILNLIRMSAKLNPLLKQALRFLKTVKLEVKLNTLPNYNIIYNRYFSGNLASFISKIKNIAQALHALHSMFFAGNCTELNSKPIHHIFLHMCFRKLHHAQLLHNNRGATVRRPCFGRVKCTFLVTAQQQQLLNQFVCPGVRTARRRRRREPVTFRQ